MFYFVGAILRRLFFLSPLLNKNAMQCKNENKKMAEKSLYDNSVNTLRTTVINHKAFNLYSAYVYGLRSNTLYLQCVLQH